MCYCCRYDCIYVLCFGCIFVGLCYVMVMSSAYEVRCSGAGGCAGVLGFGMAMFSNFRLCWAR